MAEPSSAPHLPGRSGALGAYGFRVLGIDGSADELGLQPVPDGACWPDLVLAWEPADARRRPPHAHLDDERATLLLLDGGYVELDRSSATAVVATPRPLPAADLVHPYLAGPAGIFAHWHGRAALHAGAAVVGGVAWALLGDKEAGKTTTLAFLDDLGVPIVTDDLLVTDGAHCDPGPRTLDLRPETAARRHQHGARLVRDGERARVRLALVAAPVPLGGFVVLDVGEVPRLDPVPLAARLRELQGALATAPPDGLLLDLVARPMWRFTRPRRWDAIPASLEVLLRELGRLGV